MSFSLSLDRGFRARPARGWRARRAARLRRDRVQSVLVGLCWVMLGLQAVGVAVMLVLSHWSLAGLV